MKENLAAREVRASATHVTPLKRDVMYDHRAQQAALAIEVHHTDGRTVQSVLVLTPDQVELYAVQFDQLIARREQALRAGR